ncbi:MAG: hypothetical protein ACK4PR_00495 [Gammaproteobacteria bacterium]
MTYNDLDFTTDIQNLLEVNKPALIEWTIKVLVLMLEQPHQNKMHIAEKAADHLLKRLKESKRNLFKNHPKIRDLFWKTLRCTLIEGVTLNYSDEYTGKLFTYYIIDYTFNLIRKDNNTPLPLPRYQIFEKELSNFYNELLQKQDSDKNLFPKLEDVKDKLFYKTVEGFIKNLNFFIHIPLAVLSIVTIAWPIYKIFIAPNDLASPYEISDWSAQDYMKSIADILNPYYLLAIIFIIILMKVFFRLSIRNANAFEHSIFSLNTIPLPDELKKDLYKKSIPTFFPIETAILPKPNQSDTEISSNTITINEKTESPVKTKPKIERRSLIKKDILPAPPIEKQHPAKTENRYNAIINTKVPNTCFLFFDREKVSQKIHDPNLVAKYTNMAKCPKIVPAKKYDGIVQDRQLIRLEEKGLIVWSDYKMKSCKDDQRVALHVEREERNAKNQIIRYLDASTVVDHKQRYRK